MSEATHRNASGFVVTILAAALLGACTAPLGDETQTDPDTGGLVVFASGLPIGLSASVQVTGPGAYSALLDGSTVLTDLVEGTYVVAAAPVQLDDAAVPTRYSADVAPTSVDIEAGGVVTVYVDYYRDPGSGRLWASRHGTAVLAGYDADQLAHSGTPDPAATVSVPAGATSRGIAVDSAGNVWQADTSGEVVRRLPAAGLAVGGEVEPDVVIDFEGIDPSGPWDIAFDRAGNLWVLNVNSADLVMFGSGDITTSGSPVPAVTLSSPDLFIHTEFAFDHDGNLWVMNAYTIKTVVMYPPDQLEASGTAVPAVTLDLSTAIGDGFLHDIAFDAGGNLWVQIQGGGILRLPPEQTAASGSPVADAVVERATFGASTSRSLAFDHSGDLWLVLRSPDAVARIADPASLSGSVTPPLAVEIGGSLGGLDRIAFAPPPPGLPIWAP